MRFGRSLGVACRVRVTYKYTCTGGKKSEEIMFEYRATLLLPRVFKLNNIKLISTASNVCKGSIHLTNYSLLPLINIPSRVSF